MNNLHLVKADRSIPRLGISIREAAKSVGLSEAAFRELLTDIPHLRAGRRVIIPLDGFRAWLDQRSCSARRLASLEGGQP